MPKLAKELKALEVKRLTTPGLHAVGGAPGLGLSVASTGARSWILRVVIGKQRRHMGLGPYPEVSLAEAREKAVIERKKISAGVDPIEERRVLRAAKAEEERSKLTFAEAFDLYFEDKLKDELANAKHRKQWRSTLESYAHPLIGASPVSEISTDDVLSVLKPIWSEKTETATRVRQRIEAVLDWAAVLGHRNGDNPARWKGNLAQLLPAARRLKAVRGHPAVALDDISNWFGLLRSRDGMAARALEFLALTVARSGEIRGARWDEINLDREVWTVPAERMKARHEHRVPLSAPALEILESLPRFAGSDYIFPSPRGGALSDMTISAVMRRMQEAEEEAGREGFLDTKSKRPAVPHGIRSSFRDWAAERTEFPRELAEMALAHNVGSEVERAYRRSDMMERRRQIMSDWATFLVTRAARAG